MPVRWRGQHAFCRHGRGCLHLWPIGGSVWFAPRPVTSHLYIGIAHLLVFNDRAASLPVYVAHFLLGFLSPGSVAYSKLISTWFFQRRGLALTTLGVGTLIGSVCVPPAARLLLDKLGSPRILLPFAVLALISLVGLYFSRGSMWAFVSLFLFSIGNSGQFAVTSYFVTRYFGVRNFSTIYGSLLPLMVLVSAPVPFVIGGIFDQTGSYDSALVLIAIVLIISIALLLLLQPFPYPVSQVKEGEEVSRSSLLDAESAIIA